MDPCSLPLKVVHWCHWSKSIKALDRDSLVELAIWHRVLTIKSALRLPMRLEGPFVRSLVGQIARSMSLIAGSVTNGTMDRIWIEPSGFNPDAYRHGLLAEEYISPHPS